MTRHHSCRVSPFGHPRIHARLTTPRGISQPPTSFIGSQCQGIHHAPLNTYTQTQNYFSEETLHYPNNTPTHTTCEHTSVLFRCSQPLSTNQTPHPTTKAGQQHATMTPKGATNNGLVVSKPNSVSGQSFSPALSPPPTRLLCTQPGATTAHGFLTAYTSPMEVFFVVLLRKEVIQPHLPVRLPCYDFVPIADPTFDGSLPCGLGHRLRVLPTFMT